ncbi:N-acetylmuramoyl-L-alanine amidase [Actinoplanes oblitus]|uniref:N-acetylmuramoyl-L-alanine amidase n=1 Tax=Actinoplanes oblitus TaxID=3040509 RepID=A0ABY8W760_9ACTN|nr:N-acetylmuramoyl-L-alanine amidase [Actinoplanes oblitus]WIM93684.1 N-acetylmuramoyl-L-alanine amidase [Actinoplanes oblitus]
MNRKLAIGVGAAVAVLAAGGGVAVLTWPSTPGNGTALAGVSVLPPEPGAEPPRIKTALHTVDVAGPAGVPQRATEHFSLLGVTWADPADKPAGTIQVKTRSVATGKWSGWQSLEVGDGGPDGAEAAAGARRGGTEPLWVGDSDGLATRIQGQGKGLPAGLRVDLIDPGRDTGGKGGGMVLAEGESASPTPEPSGSVSTEPSPKPSDPPSSPSSSPSSATPGTASATPSASSVPAPSSATPVPTSTAPIKAQFPAYVSRKGWSADETIVGPINVATEVKALWVHHTVHTQDANAYTCDQSAAIVRGIQIYDVRSNGWSDLGYNYMVDKCGTLFEGRRGGVEAPVVGAHTIGFNTGYAAVAVLGDYRTATSNDAIETTIAQLAAARLGKYGYNPSSTATFVAGSTNSKFRQGATVTVPRLSGHRDMDATVCPGDNLYSRLPAIRAKSQQMVTGMALRSVTGGGYAAGAYYVRDSATLTWTVATAAADLAGITVSVDGRTVSTLDGAARSVKLTVAPGRHSVTVLAAHRSGSTARVSTTLYGDPTAPTLTAPAVSLRTGTYSATSAPVTVGFTARDNLRLAAVTVSRPRSATLSGTASSWATTAKPGARVGYTLTARDVAGNARAASATQSVLYLAETKATRTGTWAGRTSGSYLGGKALTASRKNAKLTYTFTGRSAALLFSRGPRTGKAYVYLDGRKVATVDTRSGSAGHRQALWVKALASKKHTVVIVVAGTSGRPAVVSDGLAYVR